MMCTYIIQGDVNMGLQNIESDIEENIDELIKDETQENLEDTDQADPPNA